MILYPPAKINIGLAIIEKRQDGFHNIETVFYPIPLCDTLIVESVKDKTTQKLNFSCDGIELPDDHPLDNLCCKAYHLIDAVFQLPPTIIRLHKVIPVGAGLGGGSSDAAYTIQALNDLYQLRLSSEELVWYTSQLGSDCAFFLQNNPAFGSGKGDVLKSVILSLSGYYIILIKPPVFVSTADAYSSVMPKKTQCHLTKAHQYPISEWRYTIFNDFEESVFSMFPEIGQIKEKLYSEGAVFASMSGSGSSVYGIFNENPNHIADLFPDCFVWTQRL